MPSRATLPHRSGPLLALCLLLAVPALCYAEAGRSATPGPPRIELITMGPGDSMFSGFGHAALRVQRPRPGKRPKDTVYTFGAYKWTGPLLGWHFLRGEVDFYTRVRSWKKVFRDYRRQDRTIIRQELILSPDEALALAAKLEFLGRPENRSFRYHHFDNNCSTRLRDLIDEATGGALRTALAGPGDGSTAREQVLKGLSLNPGLLLVMNVVQGRPTDDPMLVWDLTFVPGELRKAVEHATRVVDGEPRPFARPLRIAYERKAPGGRWPIAWGGYLALILVLPFLVFGLALAWKRKSAGALALRWGLGGLTLYWALVGGTLGLLLDTVAMSDVVPEFSQNENLFVFCMLDGLLVVPAVLWLLGRSLGKLRKPVLGYLGLRCLGALIVLLGQGVGLGFKQSPLALALLGASATGALLAGALLNDAWRRLESEGFETGQGQEQPLGGHAAQAKGPTRKDARKDGRVRKGKKRRARP